MSNTKPENRNQSFPILKALTILLFIILILQIYHNRKWFVNIPKKTTPLTNKEKLNTKTKTKAKLKSNKDIGVKSLLSFFKQSKERKQDKIFFMDSSLDSLYREFGITRSFIKRKIQNIPKYYLEERVILNKGKPLSEYILSIKHLLNSNNFHISDTYNSPSKNRTTIEITDKKKLVRKIILTFGDSYIANYAKVSLVLEGFGKTLGKDVHKIFSTIKRPISIGIIPQTKFSKKISQMADINGWDVICQLRMESVPYQYLGKNGIYKHLSSKDILDILAKSRKNLPETRGLSIYGGGIRIAESESKILNTVLNFSKKYNYYFLDNSFASHSKIYDIGTRIGVKVLHAVGVADKKRGRENQKADMVKFLKHIQKTGNGIIIFKNGVNSIHLLKYIIPLIEDSDIKIITVSNLFK